MAPVFTVTYTSALQNNAIKHETDWVCPHGFTDHQARQSFQRSFPSASILLLSERKLC
jgi:hypothetical protein